MPSLHAAVPRRLAVLHLREEAVRRVRAPHLADVWERESEDDDEDSDEPPDRSQKPRRQRGERLAVGDERHQYEREDPRQAEPRAVGGPAERRPPGGEPEQQAKADRDEHERRANVQPPLRAREERQEARGDDQHARGEPEDEDAAAR